MQNDILHDKKWLKAKISTICLHKIGWCCTFLRMSSMTNHDHLTFLTVGLHDKLCLCRDVGADTNKCDCINIAAVLQCMDINAMPTQHNNIHIRIKDLYPVHCYKRICDK